MINDSSGLFHELVECSPDAQLVVNTQGSVLYANACAHSLFGYEPDSLRGVQIEELVPHEHRAAHLSHRQRYAVSPHTREMGTREMRLAALRRDGTLFPAEIRLAPMRGEHGLLIAAVVRDSTGNERIKSSLDSARREAEEANDAKSRFLAAASHDLRQPMQALRLIHGALVKRAEGPGVNELVGEQGHALDTMSQLLHALLNVVKLESGTVRADIAETDLCTIFADLRLQLAPIAAAKGIALDIDASGGHVLSDRTLLHELLQNLLANAVRYTDVGRVCLRCVRGPGRVRIEVEDTGIGIPAHLQETIFQDFYQVASRGSEHRGGAGLGLGIVRRVAQLLAVRVCVVSRENVGTKFTVEVSACEPARHVETSRSPAARNATHLRILIVEDEAPLRTALKMYLQLDDHEVLSAGSLCELETFLRQTEIPPDLLITDYKLGPAERGSEAVERVRQHFGREVPTIVLTGDTSAVPKRLFGQGRTRLLSKPVDAPVLAAAMNELLSSWEAVPQEGQPEATAETADRH